MKQQILTTSIVIVIVILMLSVISLTTISTYSIQEFTPTEIFIDEASAGHSPNIPRLVKMQNGNILCIYNVHTSSSNLYVSTYCKISTDNGASWPSESNLVKAGNPGTWGAHEGGLAVAPNGTILMTYLKWYSRTNSHVYLMRSFDNGSTWHDGGILPQSGVYSGYAGNGVTMSDGYTIVMGYAYDNGGSGHWTSRFLISTDNGSTWSDGGAVPNPITTDEPEFVELSNGTLYALMRGETGYLLESYSEDKGVTWSTATSSGIVSPSAPCSIRRYSWSPNIILLVWDENATAVRWPLKIAISYDDCETWVNNTTIKDEGYNVAYPDVIRTENDSILVSWWDYTNDTNHNCKSMWFPLSWLTGESENEIQFISINDGINGTIIYTSTPVFNWTLIAGASQYHLQIANDSAFAELIVNISDINEHNYPSEYDGNETRVSFTLPTSNFLDVYKTYYCRVKVYT